MDGVLELVVGRHERTIAKSITFAMERFHSQRGQPGWAVTAEGTWETGTRLVARLLVVEAQAARLLAVHVLRALRLHVCDLLLEFFCGGREPGESLGRLGRDGGCRDRHVLHGVDVVSSPRLPRPRSRRSRSSRRPSRPRKRRWRRPCSPRGWSDQFSISPAHAAKSCALSVRDSAIRPVAVVAVISPECWGPSSLTKAVAPRRISSRTCWRLKDCPAGVPRSLSGVSASRPGIL